MTELISTMAEVTLEEGYQIIFEALDPTTGATVTGVTISNASVTAEDLSGVLGFEDLDNLPPLFLPVPIEDSTEA